MENIPLHRDGRVQNVEVTETVIEATPLISLTHSNHQPENPDLDVRGYLMVGDDGRPMGRVEDILLEADRRAADRVEPLFHMEYAVIRYTDAAGLEQRLLVPMAVVKRAIPEERKVVVRGPAREACQQAYGFREPDEMSPQDEQEIYTLWEVEPRWARSGRGPRELAEQRR
jgi:hypothetical protein